LGLDMTGSSGFSASPPSPASSSSGSVVPVSVPGVWALSVPADSEESAPQPLRLSNKVNSHKDEMRTALSLLFLLCDRVKRRLASDNGRYLPLPYVYGQLCNSAR